MNTNLSPTQLFLNRAVLWLARHWELVANGLFALVLGGAILAPALMAAGLTGPAQTVYRLYAPHDHQLPQRSYFLFSPQGGVQSYSLAQVLAWGGDPRNLRAFTGNPDIGFKTALNHRMIAIFIGLLAGGLLWSSTYLQPRMTPFRLALFSFPMFLDALSHMFSEHGPFPFRQGNVWAVWLTGNAFPPDFYTGTTIGTLNWGLRTLTGLLFGLGTVWYLFAYLDRRFTAIRRVLEPRLRKVERQRRKI